MKAMLESRLSTGKNPMQRALIGTALNGIEPYVKIVPEQDVIKFFTDLSLMIPLLLEDGVSLDVFCERLEQVVGSYAGNKNSTK